VSFAPMPFITDSERIIQIQEFVTEENKKMNIQTNLNDVKIQILRGNINDVLVEISEKDTTDLMIIGTTGLSDVLTKIFGSTSVSLSNLAHCPVLLIPRDAKWKSIEKIMYASNYDSLSPTMVQEISEFAISNHADLHFVNVRNFDPMLENKQKEFNWDELWISKNPNFYFEKQTIYGNDTVKELIKYSTNKEIDMMCFVSNHRNFWQNLVHSSITENMAISSTIPLMVLHIDDKA
jgi:nucleotide-binding universal stress UspA family protein